MTPRTIPRRRSAALLAALLAALALPRPSAAGILDEKRKIGPGALSVPVERVVLPNGLVVLLAPDPTVSSVAVWMSFRAGALHGDAVRSGLAHLVEHLMASGPTPDTDYATLLERRRARWFNATTGFDFMTFEAVVPAEELPLALWVATDRLATLPGLVDAALVEKHRRVVLQERAIRNVDVPYGLVDEHLLGRLYARPHPLHGGVIGSPATLASITAEDVRTFVAARLVPANAILTLVGRFDPGVARRLVEEGLGRLPSGRRPGPASVPPWPLSMSLVEEQRELLSREPRVTLAWRFPGIPHDDATALQLGAVLLTFLTDGAWGMRIDAHLQEYAGESTFTMDLVVPYDEPARVVQDDAEAFLRLLTHREIPFEHLVAANLLLDRSALFSLDALRTRAVILTRVEDRFGGRGRVADVLARHWDLDGGVVRDTARVFLKVPKLVLHARPVRPKPARAERH